MIVVLPSERIFMDDAEKGSNALIVDLEEKKIVRPDGMKIYFEIDEFKNIAYSMDLMISLFPEKEKLLNLYTNSK